MGVLAPMSAQQDTPLSPPLTSAEIFRRTCLQSSRGGEEVYNFQTKNLINFLAKSGNSNHFSFFSKKINCGHYFCLLSTKIVDTLFPAISITHQGCACT